MLHSNERAGASGLAQISKKSSHRQLPKVKIQATPSHDRHRMHGHEPQITTGRGSLRSSRSRSPNRMAMVPLYSLVGWQKTLKTLMDGNRREVGPTLIAELHTMMNEVEEVMNLHRSPPNEDPDLGSRRDRFELPMLQPSNAPHLLIPRIDTKQQQRRRASLGEMSPSHTQAPYEANALPLSRSQMPRIAHPTSSPSPSNKLVEAQSKAQQDRFSGSSKNLNMDPPLPRQPSRRNSMGILRDPSRENSASTAQDLPKFQSPRKNSYSERNIQTVGFPDLKTPSSCKPTSPGGSRLPRSLRLRSETELHLSRNEIDYNVLQSVSTPSSRRGSLRMEEKGNLALKSDTMRSTYSHPEDNESESLLSESLSSSLRVESALRPVTCGTPRDPCALDPEGLEPPSEILNRLTREMARPSTADSLELSEVPLTNAISTFKGLWQSYSEHSVNTINAKDTCMGQDVGRDNDLASVGKQSTLSLREHRRSRTAWMPLNLETATFMLSEHERRYKEAHALMKQLNSLCGNSLKDASDNIVKTTCRTLDCSQACLYLMNREGTELQPISSLVQNTTASKDFSEYWEDPLSVTGNSVAGTCALCKSLVKVDDVQTELQFIKDLATPAGGQTARSVLCLPLVDRRGEAVAVLKAVNKRPSALESSQAGHDRSPPKTQSRKASVDDHCSSGMHSSPGQQRKSSSLPSSVAFGEEDASYIRLIMDALSTTLLTCGMMADIQEQHRTQSAAVNLLCKLGASTSERSALDRAARLVQRLLGCKKVRAYTVNQPRKSSASIFSSASQMDAIGSRSGLLGPLLTLMHPKTSGEAPCEAAIKCAQTGETTLAPLSTPSRPSTESKKRERRPSFHQAHQEQTVGKCTGPCALCLPVRAGDQEDAAVLAVIELEGDGHEFTTERQQFLAPILRLLGIMLNRLQEEAKLRAVTKRLAVRAQLMEQLAQRASVPDVIHTLANAGKQLLGVEHFRLWLLDDVKGQLWTPKMGGDEEYEVDRLPLSEGLASRCARSLAPVVVDEASKAEGYSPLFDGMVGYPGKKRTVMALPIIDLRGRFAESDTCLPTPKDADAAGGESAVQEERRRRQSLSPNLLGVVEAINKLPSSTGMVTNSPVVASGKSLRNQRQDASTSEMNEESKSSSFTSNSRVPAFDLSRVVAGTPSHREEEAEALPFSESDLKELQKFISEFLPSLRQLMLDAEWFKSKADEQGEFVDTARSEDMKGYSVRSLMSVYRRKGESRRRPKSPSPCPSPLVQLKTMMALCLKSNTGDVGDLRNWDLNILTMNKNQIFEKIIRALQYFDLIDNSKIDSLAGMLEQISSCYNTNPYHNFHHGFHVFHATFCMMCSNHIVIGDNYICLAILLAALCHDIDHPGYNNTLVVNSRSHLTTRYGDEAVLERHHLYITFKIISSEKYSIFEDLCLEEYKRARKVMLRCILATDMAKHSDIVKAVKSLEYCQEDFILDSIPMSDFCIMDAVVHSADMSGQTIELSQAIDWGDRCMEEFTNQVKMEENLSLPISVFMQGLDQKQQKGRLQADFIMHILRPLWSEMSRLLPDVLGNVIERLEITRGKYEEWAATSREEDSV